MRKKFGVIPWYLNSDKAISLLNISESNDISDAKTVGIFHVFHPVFSARKLIQNAIESHIVRNKVPTLHDLAPDSITPGKMFTMYNDFYCTGLSKIEVSDLSQIPLNAEAKIHRKVYLKKSTRTNIVFRYSPRHITSGSSFVWLSGHQKLFVVGIITKSSVKEIEATPLLIGSIGDEIIDDDPNWISKSDYGHVHLSQVEQFAKYNEWIQENRDVLTPEIINPVMKELSEQNVKKYFAEIIGEPYVGKDWGGERSDLYSGRLIVQGRQLSAAFMFKGPSKFKELKCSDLGKNGDQIDRMFTEPSDICIVSGAPPASLRVNRRSALSKVPGLTNGRPWQDGNLFSATHLRSTSKDLPRASCNIPPK